MPQQNAIKSADIINTLTASLLLIFFINSISHPSDCFYIIGLPQLLPQVFYMRVNNPFISEKFMATPHKLQSFRLAEVYQHILWITSAVLPAKAH